MHLEVVESVWDGDFPELKRKEHYFVLSCGKLLILEVGIHQRNKGEKDTNGHLLVQLIKDFRIGIVSTYVRVFTENLNRENFPNNTIIWNISVCIFLVCIAMYKLMWLYRVNQIKWTPLHCNDTSYVVIK